MIQNTGVKLIKGWGKFIDKNTVEVDGKDRYTADHILIATGGKPSLPDFPGVEHTITSDGFFELETLPKKVVVLGGGYIAVELGQVFHSLGSQTIQIVRNDVLTFVDDEVRETLFESMKLDEYDIRKGINIEKIEKTSENDLTVYLTDGTIEENVE